MTLQKLQQKKKCVFCHWLLSFCSQQTPKTTNFYRSALLVCTANTLNRTASVYRKLNRFHQTEHPYRSWKSLVSCDFRGSKGKSASCQGTHHFVTYFITKGNLSETWHSHITLHWTAELKSDYFYSVLSPWSNLLNCHMPGLVIFYELFNAMW